MMTSWLQPSGGMTERHLIGQRLPPSVVGMYLRQTPDFRLAMVVMTPPFEERLGDVSGGGGGGERSHDVQFGIMVVGGGGAGADDVGHGGREGEGGGAEKGSEEGGSVLEEGALAEEGPRWRLGGGGGGVPPASPLLIDVFFCYGYTTVSGIH